jgi:DGQHR domain-containing protein
MPAKKAAKKVAPRPSITDPRLRYSVSLVTQGDHRFYTLTVPSDILAQTCFVTTRDEDPKTGFQRVLDKARAQQIADYIDSGLGTIPSSIVLSAQPDAELRDIGGGKTVEFTPDRKAFLVIDGQHRVYGFSLARTKLRVPVVIYNGLSKRDESRLFIDINTKQKPVPNELLLDIKKLAEYENNAEKIFGEVFDMFHETPSSPLFGLTSPTARSKGKISRVTFNAGFKPLMNVFSDSDSQQVYDVTSEYLRAFKSSLKEQRVLMTSPIAFRAIMLIFPQIAARLKDRGKSYSADNFAIQMKPIFDKLKSSEFAKAKSISALFEAMSVALRKDFTI